MSLDVHLEQMEMTQVYERNITHNLTKMAAEAGLYEALWYPEKLGIVQAHELIPFLKAGLQKLIDEPERFKEYNPANGWGDYEGFVDFVASYLRACVSNPNAHVTVSR